MNNIFTILFISVICFSKSLFAQTDIGIISKVAIDQFAESEQVGFLNEILIQQISANSQFAWVFQSGEMEDEISGEVIAGGEDNYATVDQRYQGDGNMSFVYQYGSYNRSYQTQKGVGNKFNFAGDFPEPISGIASLPEGVVPNQDGDYHTITQYAEGISNQAWLYQAGRQHNASQRIAGDENQVWTSQSGYTQSSEMIIVGNRNGSHFLEHEEGKFPHSDEDDESSEGNPGGSGNGNSGNSGGGSDDGGMPEVIPPPHDEDHVFVPTVGVAIKQMGSNSEAFMYIEGNDNKAVITQRGGAGTNENGKGSCDGGHYVDQDIYGNWNRIYADQRGTGHYIDQYVNGENNLAVFMQKGNGSHSELTLFGISNEIGVDQKGKNNISDVDVVGNFNGNFDLLIDEFGVKLVQEGKGNRSDIDIAGDYNFIAVHQNGGAISVVNQVGNWNSATVNQESLDDH